MNEVLKRMCRDCGADIRNLADNCPKCGSRNVISFIDVDQRPSSFFNFFARSTLSTDVAYSDPIIQPDAARYLPRLNKLNAELDQLKAQIVQDKLIAEDQDGQLKQLKLELSRKERIRHLLEQVEPIAQRLLLEDDAFVEQFNVEHCDSFVMAVDIRRSTDLMLKATDPRAFAVFATGICDKIRDIIWSEHGVFDKFTGDGVLAFFPTFCSGDDAGFLVMRAAQRCHDLFRKEYDLHGSSFEAVIDDVGLGIGIDFGKTHLVSLWGGLTVVGRPVVYACRLSGAPAGETLLNRKAYDVVFQKYSAYCDFEMTTIEFKNDGPHRAHRVKLNEKQPKLADPNWLTHVSIQ